MDIAGPSYTAGAVAPSPSERPPTIANVMETVLQIAKDVAQIKSVLQIPGRPNFPVLNFGTDRRDNDEAKAAALENAYQRYLAHERSMLQLHPLPAPAGAGRAGSVLVEVEGDLFTAPPEVALGHCVDQSFAMSKGIAVQFKERYGHLEHLKRLGKKVGQVALLPVPQQNDKIKYIFYLVTKSNIKNGEKPTWENFKSSIREMARLCRDLGIDRLALPRIGCGLDGLNWSRVKTLLIEEFRETNTKITIFHKKNEPLRPANEDTSPSYAEAAAARPPFVFTASTKIRQNDARGEEGGGVRAAPASVASLGGGGERDACAPAQQPNFKRVNKRAKRRRKKSAMKTAPSRKSDPPKSATPVVDATKDSAASAACENSVTTDEEASATLSTETQPGENADLNILAISSPSATSEQQSSCEGRGAPSAAGAPTTALGLHRQVEQTQSPLDASDVVPSKFNFHFQNPFESDFAKRLALNMSVTNNVTNDLITLSSPQPPPMFNILSQNQFSPFSDAFSDPQVVGMSQAEATGTRVSELAGSGSMSNPELTPGSAPTVERRIAGGRLPSGVVGGVRTRSQTASTVNSLSTQKNPPNKRMRPST